MPDGAHRPSRTNVFAVDRRDRSGLFACLNLSVERQRKSMAGVFTLSAAMRRMIRPWGPIGFW